MNSARAHAPASSSDNPAVLGFEGLYYRRFGVVWSVVTSMGVRPAYRDDVVQDTWTLVYRKLDRLRPDASERAWVAALARGVALRHHRSQRRRDRKHLALAAAGQAESPAADRYEARSTAAAILEGMNPEQRLAYVLVHAHGMSAPEVAAATNASPNTIYSRLRLARRFVQRSARRAGIDEATIAALATTDEHDAARRKTWAALLVWIPKPSSTLAGGLAAASGLRIFAATVAIGLGALSSARVAAQQLSGLQPAAVRAAVAGPDPSRASASEGQSREAASVAPTTADEGSDHAPPTAVAVASDRGVPLRRRPDRRPVSAQSADGPAVTTTNVERQRPSLAADARLLAQARGALRDGDPARSLSLLGLHETRFTGSALTDIRDATTIEALCRVGEVERAQALTEQFASTHPRSPALSVVQKSCAPP